MQVEHKTEKGKVLFVKLNFEPYYPATVINEANSSYIIYKKKADKGYKTIRHKLPLADWKLIGLTSEVTEEQARRMVDNISQRGGDEILYKDYLEHDYNKYNNYPISSFKSLMQHLQVYDVNPYVGYDKNNLFTNKQEIDFYKAESRTGKWLVLFKPNEK